MTILLLATMLSVLIGLSLGLLGGGSSMLTVPILIYVLGIEPKSAIATSLLVVGVTSLAGAAARLRLVRGRHGALPCGQAALLAASKWNVLGGAL